MELPEDVLAIVRAYAKPRFTYFREYNEILKVLGKKEWPALKKKLLTLKKPLEGIIQHIIDMKVQNREQD